MRKSRTPAQDRLNKLVAKRPEVASTIRNGIKSPCGNKHSVQYRLAKIRKKNDNSTKVEKQQNEKEAEENGGLNVKSQIANELPKAISKSDSKDICNGEKSDKLLLGN